MGLGRKAIYFSLVSLFIVILFTATSQLTSKYKQGESELEVTRTRVMLLNAVVRDIEDNYLDSIVYVTSKNALTGISKYLAKNNFNSVYFSYYNLPIVLNSTMKSGLYIIDSHTKLNLTDNAFCPGPCISANSVLDKFMALFQERTDDLGLALKKFDIEIVSIRQEDARNFRIDAKVDYFFEDSSKVASWKGQTNRTVYVSVNGLNISTDCGIRTITPDWPDDEPGYPSGSVLGRLQGKDDGAPSIHPPGCII